jgi:Membrane bound O-acyl transferase family
MRAITWSFQRKPFRRVPLTVTTLQQANDDQARTALSIRQLAIDAFELCYNMRGCGWNWSTGLRIPPETRPTSSTTAFVLTVLASLTIHMVIWDCFQYSVQWFAPLTLGSAKGGTIYDLSMPFAQQYLRSSAITLLTILSIYCAIQIAYDFATLIGIVVFCQHISSYPPVFKNPWFATSLCEFWAECWHQSFRYSFIFIGGKPMAWLMGRIGGILGTFFISAVLHDFGLWGMGNGSDFPRMASFFMMMAVGIIMEHAFKRFAGRKVGGFLGWMWMSIWALAWAHLVVEAWALRGLMGSALMPCSVRPTFRIFGPLPGFC